MTIAPGSYSDPPMPDWATRSHKLGRRSTVAPLHQISRSTHSARRSRCSKGYTIALGAGSEDDHCDLVGGLCLLYKNGELCAQWLSAVLGGCGHAYSKALLRCYRQV